MSVLSALVHDNFWVCWSLQHRTKIDTSFWMVRTAQDDGDCLAAQVQDDSINLLV